MPELGGDGYQELLRLQQQQQQHAQQQQQLGAAGGKAVGAAPKHAAPADRYTLLGLLSVIRMTDHDLTMLALGTDLTSLGLNLNSPDSLYKTFVSPLAEVPVRPEPDWTVPQCYKHTPPRLQPGYLQKFKEETLFYIFFSMPQVGGWGLAWRISRIHACVNLSHRDMCGGAAGHAI